ncbi:MAG: hypothetical protein U1E33_03390 [Rhodospirillales bacterium]
MALTSASPMRRSKGIRFTSPGLPAPNLPRLKPAKAKPKLFAGKPVQPDLDFELT